MKAHIIKCNDRDVCVVLGTPEAAASEVQRQQKLHYEQHGYMWKDKADYEAWCFWRFRTVEVVQPSDSLIEAAERALPLLANMTYKGSDDMGVHEALRVAINEAKEQA